MANIIKFITENPLISSLVVAAIVGLIGWGGKTWKDHQDARKIYNFLISSKNQTSYTFRSTEAISAHTNLPESRVAKLCARHPKIRRNEKEKQSWRVVG